MLVSVAPVLSVAILLYAGPIGVNSSIVQGIATTSTGANQNFHDVTTSYCVYCVCFLMNYDYCDSLSSSPVSSKHCHMSVCSLLRFWDHC